MGLPMDKGKRKKLKAGGWQIGDTKEFLGLPDEEMAFIELKLSLSQSVKEYRKKQRLTQAELAKKLKSSQSRVAKMEAGDHSVSIDLLIKSLLVLGATKKDVAKSMSRPSNALHEKLAS